jgi:hypothetical protein
VSNTKAAIKNVHNREFIQIDTKHHGHNALPNNSEKIIGHHAKFFRGACQRSFLDQFTRMQRGNSNAVTQNANNDIQFIRIDEQLYHKI